MTEKIKSYNGCTTVMFTASHNGNFKNKCSDNKKHNHKWKVVVFIESDKLNKEFVVKDFNEIENLKTIFHKKYLNELKVFKDKIPTTEVIGDWFVDNINECYQVIVYEGKSMFWKFWDKRNRYVICYGKNKRNKYE